MADLYSPVHRELNQGFIIGFHSYSPSAHFADRDQLGFGHGQVIMFIDSFGI